MQMHYQPNYIQFLHVQHQSRLTFPDEPCIFSLQKAGLGNKIFNTEPLIEPIFAIHFRKNRQEYFVYQV